MSAPGLADRRDERTAVGATLTMSLLAWGTLAATTPSAGHDHAAPATAPLTFLSAWLLMVAAMMAPVSLTFVTAIHRLVGARPDRHVLRAIAVAGYGVPWTVVGAGAYGAACGLDALRGHWAWLGERPWLATAAALALAGGYQLTPVALRCLQQCRNPTGFVARGWHGVAPRRDMALVAVAYGWSCVGCCWALMSLMTVVGAAGLPLMLLLTAVMAAERYARGLDRVAGAVLLCAAVLTVVVQAH
jgi:predicted metal-binding membrane protein